MTLSKNNTQHQVALCFAYKNCYAECHYARHNYFVMPSVIMPNVVLPFRCSSMDKLRL